MKHQQKVKSNPIGFGIIKKLAVTYLLLGICLFGLFISNISTINQYSQITNDTSVLSDITRNLQNADICERTFMYTANYYDHNNAVFYTDQALQLYNSSSDELLASIEPLNTLSLISEYQSSGQEFSLLTTEKNSLEGELEKFSNSSLDVIERMKEFIQFEYDYLISQPELSADKISHNTAQMALANSICQDFLIIERLESDYALTGKADTLQAIQEHLTIVTDLTKSLEKGFDNNIDRIQAQVIQDNITDYQTNLIRYQDTLQQINKQKESYNLLSQRTLALSSEMNTHNMALIQQEKIETTKLGVLLIFISFIIVCLSIFILIYFVKNPISKFNRTLKYAIDHNDISQDILLSHKDELYYLAQEFNNFTHHIRQIIIMLQGSSRDLNQDSTSLNQAIEKLNGNIMGISHKLASLEEAMKQNVRIIHAIQLVSTDIELAVTSSSKLAIEESIAANESLEKAKKINDLIKTSQSTSMQALSQTKNALKVSLENAKVVNQISSLSNTIKKISDQTRLLSLNAAIESQRAGKSGAGFATVAVNIKKLSEETQSVISQIQTLTQNVILSVNDLSDHSNEMIEFFDVEIHNTFSLCERMSSQYMMDTERFNKQFNSFDKTMKNVVSSVQDIASSINQITHEIFTSSADITDIAVEMENIQVISNSVSDTSIHTKNASAELASITSVFKIN